MNAIALLNRLIPALAAATLAIATVSCQNSAPPETALPKTTRQSNWVKVSSQPPTYYPRGVAADCPTDHWSGEWVYTGDDRGTRYFIPLHGLGDMNRQELVDEALSARSQRKMEQIAAEDQEILATNIRNLALFGPPVYTGLLLAAMGGGSTPEIDIHRLQKEWDSSKQPH